MFTAIETASQAYLETHLLSAEIVVPFPVSSFYLTSLRSACSMLSLHMPLITQPPAGILAAHAHGIDGKCTDHLARPQKDKADDFPQLILTIDYSRAALTGLLLIEECSVFECRRVLHNTNLGTDSIDNMVEVDNIQHPGGLGRLKHALRQLTTLPLEDGNGAGLRQISKLVLVGESAGDARLEEALKEVLVEQPDVVK
ncbi:hypothetical protein ACLMJK_009432 [Lecanora helva]